MPRVKGPQVGQVTANAAPNVTQSANASADSFGAGQARDVQRLGAGLQDVGGSLGKLAIVGQDRVDKAIARDTLNQARTDMRTFMADVYSRKGKDAINAYGETQKKVDELRKKYGALLKTPNQRDLFATSFDSLSNEHLDKSVVFGEKAKVEYENNSLDAENQNAIEDAVANRTDPRAIHQAEVTLIQNTRYKFRGQSPEFVAEEVEKARHALHKGVLDSIAVDSPVAAKEYFKKFEKRFDPSERDAIKKTLEKEALSFEVRQTALQWSVEGRTYEDQIKEIDKVKDPERAKLLKAEVETRTATRDAVVKRKQNDTEDAFWTQVKNGGGVPWGRVRGEVAKDMFAYQQALVRGFAPTSDRATLLRLGTLTDQELRDHDTAALVETAQSLTKEDFEAIFERHKNLKLDKATDADDSRFKSVRADATMIGDLLEGAGFTVTGKKGGDRKKNADAINRFWTAYDYRVAESERTSGKKLDSLQKRDIAEKLLIEAPTKGWFGLSKKPLFNIKLDDIDTGTRKKLREALEKTGTAVTEAAMLELYGRYTEAKAKSDG